MDTLMLNDYDKNKRKGQIGSFIIHLLLLLFFFIPMISYQDPPPGQAGILIALGNPDEGQGEEMSAPSEAAAPAEEVETESNEEEAEPEKPEPKPKETTKKSTRDKDVVSDDSKEKAIKKKEKEQKEKDRKEKRDKEKRDKEKKDAKKKADAAKKAAKAKADAAAAAAAAEAKKIADAKSGFSDMFNSGGQGDTGRDGNQGDPNGDPDATKLDGISTGSGDIGGGLKGRGVKKKPSIKSDTGKQGDVVMKVCVDESGKVISADYTQSGSTTSDSQLIKVAKNAARKYSFEEGEIDRQCGTIKIKFRLQ